MRVASFLIPHLPVQVERQRDPSLAEAPLIVGGRPWDDGVVLDCCPQAKAADVERGTRLSQAEALCPTARFVPADEEAYRAVHKALFNLACRFTPIVETGELGLVYADVSGLKRRFDSDAELARQLAQEAVKSVDLDVRIGLGSSKFVAEQAARAAQPRDDCVVPPGEEQAFLSPLDISVLPIDQEMERRLRLLGVRTLGALARLPRVAVVRQFGSHAGPLYDLARGVDPRPVHADAPPLALERTRSFNDPLSERGPLLAHLEQMVADLSETLSRRGYQGEGIRLSLEERLGEIHVTGKPVKPPSADVEKLSRLAGRLLGEVTVSEPVSALSLTVYPLRPFHLGATQLALFRGASDSSPTLGQALREALRRLRHRFGEMIVTVAALTGPPPPVPVQVTTDPEGLPRGVVWRDRFREVVTVYEAWRIRKRWWSQPIDRDYFRLELNGGQMRVIFRDVRADEWSLERRHI